MAELPGIIICGASGRMGQMLIETVTQSDKAKLICVTERTGHDWIGKDLGEVMGAAANGVPVVNDASSLMGKGVAVIDFTSPNATVALSEQAARTGARHIIGTTGFAPEELTAIEKSAAKTVIVRAGNMSLGVNLLVRLTEKVAAALDEDFDIEVIEAHHRHKVDAPSGTALMLGKAAADGRGISLDNSSERGRDGITGERGRGTIGFSAIRGGDIVGEHDVVFAADGERIVLRHLATDRAIFARGALKAALWSLDKKPGEYSMMDVLGL